MIPGPDPHMYPTCIRTKYSQPNTMLLQIKANDFFFTIDGCSSISGMDWSSASLNVL